jgi:hypothetical protein
MGPFLGAPYVDQTAGYYSIYSADPPLPDRIGPLESAENKLRVRQLQQQLLFVVAGENCWMAADITIAPKNRGFKLVIRIEEQEQQEEEQDFGAPVPFLLETGNPIFVVCMCGFCCWRIRSAAGFYHVVTIKLESGQRRR